MQQQPNSASNSASSSAAAISFVALKYLSAVCRGPSDDPSHRLATLQTSQPRGLSAFNFGFQDYEKFWMNDSDAVVSLDYHETMLWFLSRGDHCVNCPSEATLIFTSGRPDSIIIEVHKRGME